MKALATASLMDTSENCLLSSLYVPLMTEDVLLILEMNESASSICFSTQPVNSLLHSVDPSSSMIDDGFSTTLDNRL